MVAAGVVVLIPLTAPNLPWRRHSGKVSRSQPVCGAPRAHSSREAREVRPQRAVGAAPVKLLPASCRSTRLVSSPRLDGMGPDRLLSPSCR